MSSSTEATARASRNDGQWALGQREPQNPNEVFKAEDDGLNVRARVEETYSKQGFASIPGDDLRGRLRWWGLYTQRKPGIDGGRTASIAPEELEDEFFMLRIRSDGGRLTLEQLRTIASISIEFGRSTADVTDRENIQLHWVRVEDVPEIWRRLEAVGLTTGEACGDTPRVILGSPVAGVAADEIIDGTPAIESIVRHYILDHEFSNLPRKFKTAISGSPRLDVAHEINDVSFVGVVHPEHGPGFDLWVGGGLSTNPHLAVRLGAWVPLQEVPEVWAGVAAIFRDYGYRRLRNKARLKFLVADWGPQRFREVLEGEYLHRSLVDGPAPEARQIGSRDHLGVNAQKDGRFYIGAAPAVGRLSGELLMGLARIAERVGSDRVHLTAHQKIVMLNVAGEHVDSAVAAIEALGLQVRASSFRRGTMACTGVEYCKLAMVETKGRATELIAELEQRLPGFNTPLSIHVNGCPNSCARIQVADIGLKGIRLRDEDGSDVEGFQVHLGGALGQHANFGRTLRGLKVKARDLPDYIEQLLRNFEQDADDGQSFAEWAVLADEELLQ
ncbi:MAG: nitrite/sulfite reductase [Candidatus Nanopelagicales bacterium]